MLAEPTLRSDAPQLPITLAVITYNEQEQIARCLDSVQFVSEKLVIDCGSTDNTAEIAKKSGARVVYQPWLGFGKQRQFATAQAQHDWVMMLDADESVSLELHQECIRDLAKILENQHLGVIHVQRCTLYMGKPMRWYRPMRAESIARIYHRQRAHWNHARVHESLVTKARAAHLKAPLLHAHNPTLVHKQLKVVRYAELKALDWKAKNKPLRMWQCPLVFLLAFIKDYIFRLAILDGWRGFIVTQTAASYALYKRMRYYEMRYNQESLPLAHKQLCKHLLERDTQ